MKIALLGYGKMGKAIETIAQEEGDEIVMRLSSSNAEELTAENLKQADVAIDFSRPDLAFHHIEQALQAGVPILSGTTGWLSRMPEAQALALAHEGAFLYAANFSVGVNLFFAVSRFLAERMATRPEYNVQIREIHHTRKLDAPSGTAIHLAEEVLSFLPNKTGWVNNKPAGPHDIVIDSERIGETPGTHELTYTSAIDTLTLRHQAHSREGFARGALLAARWIIQPGRQGVFTMDDVLFT